MTGNTRTYAPTVLCEYVVRPGHHIPMAGDTFLTESSVSGRLLSTTVRRIVDMRWQRDGSLRMQLIGRRQLVRQEVAP